MRLVLGPVVWAALALQLWLTLRASMANGRGLAGGLALYFSFFTILTNTLVALTLTLPAVTPSSRLGRFFARPATVTGVAAAIALVGGVYVTLLRHVWEPRGAQLVADVVLHYVTPVLFLLFWWSAVDARDVGHGDVPAMLVYPLCYLGYALARGAATDEYPYYFIDAAQLGYGTVAANAAALTAVFAAVAAMLVAVGRRRGDRR